MLSSTTWLIFGRLLPERKPHKQFLLCLLNSWCISLCVSANNRPEFTTLRIFFLMYTLYALNATTVYTSKLITKFAHPSYEEQIDTIEEIIESGLPFGKINVFIFENTLKVVHSLCLNRRKRRIS